MSKESRNKKYKIALVFLFILVSIRILLPYGIKSGINYFLSHDLDDYQGHVDDFDLKIYRGLYRCKGVKIWKPTESTGHPLLSINELEFHLDWKALFKKKILGNIFVDGAHVDIVTSAKRQPPKIPLEKLLREWIVKLVPVRLDSIVVRNSSVTIRGLDFKIPMSIVIDEISATAENLTNYNRSGKTLPTAVSAKARLQKNSYIEGHIFSNFTVDPPLLDGSFQVNKFDLTKINDVFLAYELMTFQKGYFSVYGEFVLKNDYVKGYIKPFFEDLKIVMPKDKLKNPKRTLLQFGSSVANLILRNKDTKAVATKIEFGGYVKNTEVNKSDAFWTSLKNAFIEALKKGIEKSISLKSISFNTN
ncbi:MAG: hypothetical protein ACXVCY_13560 [Pseudobdellovibrionaceae bacterium]